MAKDKELAKLSREDLLENLEGGLYDLLTSEEEYADLAEMTLALGIRHFLQARFGETPREELAPLFEDAEQLLAELVAHAGEMGLVDLDAEDEEEEE
ncbi:hypothetical protein M7784_07685 [Desulfovibrio aminophilus]|nr:hypothetical protein [Desulfovibrio aminophilus]MCM0755128.1 hypothetical protein [Desulfovibrio aminophilus]